MSGNLRECYNESQTNRNTIGMPENCYPYRQPAPKDTEYHYERHYKSLLKAGYNYKYKLNVIINIHT